MPLDLEICIPEGDFVFKVAEICESLDYTELFNTYLRAWRKVNLKPLLSRVKCVCLQNLNKKIGVLYKKSDADTFRQSVQKVFSFFASNLLENYSKI